MNTAVVDLSEDAPEPSRRRPGRPRGRARVNPAFDRRRFELLQAAARTFNAKGFHQATLADVADELGVTKPAIYYYARSKDELLFACGKLALDSLSEVLDSSNADLAGRDRLDHFFRRYGEIICEDFGRCLVLTEPRDFAPKSRSRIVAGRRRLNRAVRAMIVAGIADGSIRPCDDRALAMALFDAFNGLARWFDRKGPMSLKTIVDRYLSFFAVGVDGRQRTDDGAKAAGRIHVA